MALDRNKELVREHYRAFREGDTATIERQIAADFLDHEAPPGSGNGPAAVLRWRAVVYQAFPDLRLTVQDLIAEDDRVAVRATWQGTHEGEFLGLPATHRSVTFSGMVFWRIANGQLAERWATIDRVSLLQQLGNPM